MVYAKLKKSSVSIQINCLEKIINIKKPDHIYKNNYLKKINHLNI